MIKKIILLIFVFCFIKCTTDQGGGGVIYTFILKNNSNHYIEIFEINQANNKKIKILNKINNNDSLIDYIKNTLPDPIYPQFLEHSIEIVYDNKKNIRLLTPPSFSIHAIRKDDSIYKSIHNLNNYSQINSNTYKYTFTEKDYLLADTIIN